MKREYSSGGVVFKREGERLRWLLGKHSGYHKWVLPKGMIEAGETAEETAVREVQEEMGVEAKIIGAESLSVEEYFFYADYKQEPGQRRVMKYQEEGGGKIKVFKTVKWWLMEWVKGDPTDHDFEMEDGGWFTFDEAMEKLAFEGEKTALTKARDILDKRS
jgi:8-oxo-dGTP pyrophosphatase MutT (NUDIX family)